MNKPAHLRDTFPVCAAFIADLRAVFGADVINPQQQAGMRGIPVFYARENGVEIGTRHVPAGTVINGVQMVIIKPKKEEKQCY